MTTETYYDAKNPLFLYDMDKLCAICLRKLEKDKSHSIHTAISISEPITNVFEVLGSFSTFKIENGPDKLCTTCFSNAKAAYKFQQMCNKAQEYIENYLRHQTILETKIEARDEVSLVEESHETVLEQGEVKTEQEQEQQDGKKKVKCKVCHKLYQPYYIRLHMRMHSGEKPYKCKICKNKGFSQKRALNLHMQYHKNERKYMCSYCGKSFNFSCGLNAHIRIHTGEKPFKCNLCDLAFSTHHGRTRHMDVHTKEKRFTCEVCAKSFNRMSNLRVHTKIHTNDKQHVCSLCGKAFIQAHSLRSHLQTHAKTTDGRMEFQSNTIETLTVKELDEEVDAATIEDENTETYFFKN